MKEILGIDVGQVTPDGKFSLEATRCIGACGLTPVFTVNDEVYGKATPEIMEKVIFSLTSSKKLAEAISKKSGIPMGKSEVLRFADGEIMAKCNSDVQGKIC